MNFNAQIFSLTMLACTLSGCLVVKGPTSTYNIGTDVTRTDAKGDTEKWSAENGWASDRQPEAKIQRLPVWYISLQDSGIKAWRYGFSSESNYRYIDPLSPIVTSSEFSANGWATYLVKGNVERDFIVKRADFANNGKPEVIGNLERFRNEWRFTTKSGETFAAYDYYLTSKGIVLFRSGNVFTYLPAKTPKAQMLPEGWRFAWVQKGDMESSRIVLAQRQVENSFMELPRYEIGFFDIDKGKFTQTIQMTLPPKTEAANFSNKFHLYNTAKGPLTIAIEDAQKHVTIRNLKTGESRVAFERDAGIAFLATTQANTGRIAIKAAVGLSDEVVYDAEDFLYSGNRIPPKL